MCATTTNPATAHAATREPIRRLIVLARMQSLRLPTRRSYGLLGVAGLASLAGCQQGPDNTFATSAVSDGAAGVAAYVARHGDVVAACFLPEPAMQGPGAIQGVADPAAKTAVAVNRLVVAVDSSGSMAARSGGETKMDAAKRAAVAFLATVPSKTQVGVVAFGHRGNNKASGKAESCRAVEPIFPLAANDRAGVTRALGQIRPTGWTPLASAITTAGAFFSPSTTPGAQVVYIVSDGLETCGGDPVAAARALAKSPVKAIVNIVGFDLSSADRAQLGAVAAAGGGSFVEVRSGADIARALDQIEHKASAVSAMTTEYFDAGGRITANNLASGKYTTALNQCLSRSTSAERDGVAKAAASLPPADRAAMMEAVRARHAQARARADALAAHVLASANSANAAITAQQGNSERRLEIKR